MTKLLKNTKEPALARVRRTGSPAVGRLHTELPCTPQLHPGCGPRRLDSGTQRCRTAVLTAAPVTAVRRRRQPPSVNRHTDGLGVGCAPKAPKASGANTRYDPEGPRTHGAE